ncbi:MAG: restriction endonuclease subunit S [Longimonas sp.]|uniref:restriction endonuclease subunit S n=1 Tax=Longimonas sp. TaxID=2039626 RepID=UPI00335A2BB4
MNQYPAYKESDIEWLGEVPEHWSLRKLKYAVTLTKEDAEERHEDFQIALENIESWTGQFIETDSDYRGSGDAFEKGDILFNKLRPYLAKVYHAKRAGTPVGELLVLRPETDVLSRFLFYRLLSAEFIDVVDGSTYGAKMPRASWDFIGDLSIPIPPLPEQRTIAAYLDRKTEQIDTLIAKKQRLIDLLQEQRTAIINRAVTQGLDPNVPMQDSGIEWLGKVPAHWEILAFKYCADIATGQVDPQKYEEMTLIAPNHIESGTGKLRSLETVEEQGATSGKYLFDRADVLYSKIRPELRKVCMAPCDGLCSADMYPITPRDGMLPEFLMHVLLSESFSQFAVLASERVAMPKVNRDALNDFIVVRPPVDEQRQIIEHLAGDLSKIDMVVERERELIQKLQELRTSLISEIVTGKIDVRDELPERAEVAA